MDYLPDIIDYNLRVLFIGFNPGLKSAEVGHHYAGSSNNFWKLLYESSLTPYKLKPEQDFELLKMGYGSTNIIKRPTRSASELVLAEFREGSIVLKNLLEKFQPVFACYVGIGVYKMLTGSKNIKSGLQNGSVINGIFDYVCSSPSGLNRIPYKEQLECFIGLKNLASDLINM